MGTTEGLCQYAARRLTQKHTYNPWLYMQWMGLEAAAPEVAVGAFMPVRCASLVGFTPEESTAYNVQEDRRLDSSVSS
jgi:hypothetical protein